MPKQSSKKLKENVEKDLTGAFCQLLSEIRTPKEAHQFCEAFFSPSEMSMLMKRLGIAYELEENKPYLEIQKELNVSSATIATVAMRLHLPGYKKALSLLHTAFWAKNWSKKLLRPFKK
jgi:uncharacterized protein YerC